MSSREDFPAPEGPRIPVSVLGSAVVVVVVAQQPAGWLPENAAAGAAAAATPYLATAISVEVAEAERAGNPALPSRKAPDKFEDIDSGLPPLTTEEAAPSPPGYVPAAAVGPANPDTRDNTGSSG
ncbi:unnamed protein product [Ectocarpus sp. 13 AM-2016]